MARCTIILCYGHEAKQAAIVQSNKKALCGIAESWERSPLIGDRGKRRNRIRATVDRINFSGHPIRRAILRNGPRNGRAAFAGDQMRRMQQLLQFFGLDAPSWSGEDLTRLLFHTQAAPKLGIGHRRDRHGLAHRVAWSRRGQDQAIGTRDRNGRPAGFPRCI